MVMEKEFNYVYITTNIKNGKQYVGSHSTNNIDDNYLGTGRYFLRAVKKEGKENFKREILQICENILEARELEGPAIEKYNTLYPNGYNLSPKGGIGFKGATHSEETKRKQSEWQLGKTYIELYGHEKAAHIKEKQRQKKVGISTKRKGKGIKQELIEKYGFDEGIKRYEEFRQKQKKSHIGKTHEPLQQQWIKIYGEEEGKRKYEEYKSSNKYFNNTGQNHPNWGKKFSKEKIENIKRAQKLSFYKKLDKEKVMLIKEMYYQSKTYKEMIKTTGYHLNKIKRIIKEELWAA